jgi:hypothetical protein
MPDLNSNSQVDTYIQRRSLCRRILMSTAKDELGAQVVKQGVALGSTLGGAAAGAAAGAGATNLAAAAAGAEFAGVVKGTAMAGYIASHGMATPAAWALLATNPLTMPIAAAAGAVAGGVIAYKFFKWLAR